MSNTNYPPSYTTNQGQGSRYSNSNNKNILIGILAAGLLGSWGYVLYNSNDQKATVQTLQTQSQTYLTERDSLRLLYNDAEMHLDSLTGANHGLQSELDGAKSKLQKEIDAKKAEIRRILNNQNASGAELKKARVLIAELNDKISNLETEVARLTGENEQLAATNTQLQSEKQVVEQSLQATTVQKEELEKTVEVGSTFSASNIQVTPINEKRKGKEKETTSAKKVDKLLITFDVENRIAKSGPADMYIIVTAPDGKIISDATLNSGSLTTREDGERNYTTKVSIDYSQGSKKTIQFPVKQDDFVKGDYKIEIYHNGFKIGQSIKSLRKGGLFG